MWKEPKKYLGSILIIFMFNAYGQICADLKDLPTLARSFTDVKEEIKFKTLKEEQVNEIVKAHVIKTYKINLRQFQYKEAFGFNDGIKYFEIIEVENACKGYMIVGAIKEDSIVLSTQLISDSDKAYSKTDHPNANYYKEIRIETDYVTSVNMAKIQYSFDKRFVFVGVDDGRIIKTK